MKAPYTGLFFKTWNLFLPRIKLQVRYVESFLKGDNTCEAARAVHMTKILVTKLAFSIPSSISGEI